MIHVRRFAPAFLLSALGAYLLWRLWGVLAPFLVALFLAALLDPVVVDLEKRGMGRPRAVGFIFLAALLVLVIGAILVIPSVVRQVTDLASNVAIYSENVTKAAERWTERADRWYEDRRSTMEALGLTARPSEYLRKQSGPISDAVGEALNSLRLAVARSFGHALWFIIVPLSLYYFMLDYPALKRRAIWLVPEPRRSSVEQMLTEVLSAFSAYVRGLAKVCALYGLCACLLFWILRLSYALFLGTAAGVLYAVPYVGPLATLVGVVAIGITTGKSGAFILLAAILYISMHLAFDYGITPRVVGGSVGLHPLMNILALMCGVTLFGLWGMILAVPVAASLKRLIIHFWPRLAEAPPSSDSPPPEPAS